eukprot:683173-Ditylum_brightwellii.AAC.1
MSRHSHHHPHYYPHRMTSDSGILNNSIADTLFESAVVVVFESDVDVGGKDAKDAGFTTESFKLDCKPKFAMLTDAVLVGSQLDRTTSSVI